MPELTPVDSLETYITYSENALKGLYDEQNADDMLQIIESADSGVGTDIYTADVLKKVVDQLWNPVAGVEPPIQKARIDIVGGRILLSSIPFVTEQGGVLWKFFTYDPNVDILSPRLYYLFSGAPKELNYPLGSRVMDFSFMELPKTLQPYSYIKRGAGYSSSIPLTKIFQDAGWVVRSRNDSIRKQQMDPEEVAHMILTEFVQVPQRLQTR